MAALHMSASIDTSAMAAAVSDANAAAAAAMSASTAASAAAASASSAASAVAARVSTIESAPYIRGVVGKATIAAAIGVGATVPLTVTLRGPDGQPYTMPNTSYNAIAGIEGDDGLLGNLSCMIKAGSKTTTGCVVNVKNNALVSLGLSATVTVVAFYA